jgi:hypothetical protein
VISFVLPGFLYAAGAAALGVVVLHLLVTQQPKTDILPTVRFFPDVVARSTSVTIRPSDLWLLLLRVLTILLVGAALAQPRITPEHRAVARLVAVDLSRAVGRPAQLADSARKYLAGASGVVLFGAQAREATTAAAADSLAAFAGRPAAARQRGALSPALVAALRAASRIREQADSIELVIVSAFAREEADAATPTIRALWPGRVTLVRVAAAEDASPDARRGGAADAPRIEWADSGATTTWAARGRTDTIGAVRAGDAVLVFPFVRRWQRRSTGDSARSGDARVIARWADGEPAAVERAAGTACVRSVAVAMPTAGDAILRPEFVRFAEALAAPCGAFHDYSPLSTELMTSLAGGSRLAPASAVTPRAARTTPLVPWLLAAALVLALLELLVRRRRAPSLAEPDASVAAVPRQAA